MKRPQFISPRLASAAVTLLVGGTALGLSLDHGIATIDYQQAAWDATASGVGLPAPVLTLSAFFDSDAAGTLTYADLLKLRQPHPPYLGQVYRMNGASVTNLPQRTLQPTTFAYSKGHLEEHSGVIGLAGVSQFSAASGGVLLFGDFTLARDLSRVARGGSGWYLRGNIPPGAPAFDLLEVAITEREDGFTIVGSLAVSFEVANFLFATPGDALRVVGRFQFDGWTEPQVPKPPTISGVELIGEQLELRVTGGTPGVVFTVLSASSPEAPGDAWEPVVAGAFDAEGNAVVSVASVAVGGGRYFRLRLP